MSEETFEDNIKALGDENAAKPKSSMAKIVASYWFEVGQQSLQPEIQDLEAKLSSQWDSGYRHGVKEASGKIKSLEAKLSKATQELRHTLDRFCVLEGELQDEKLTRLQIKGMVEAIEKTLEEIEKGE